MRKVYAPQIRAASEPLHISVNIRNAYVKVLASFEIYMHALRGYLNLLCYAQA